MNRVPVTKRSNPAPLSRWTDPRRACLTTTSMKMRFRASFRASKYSGSKSTPSITTPYWPEKGRAEPNEVRRQAQRRGPPLVRGRHWQVEIESRTTLRTLLGGQPVGAVLLRRPHRFRDPAASPDCGRRWAAAASHAGGAQGADEHANEIRTGANVQFRVERLLKLDSCEEPDDRRCGGRGIDVAA